ncbi:glutamate-rich WD repeat-containing protein 1-like [Sycon ciliatum]|uniref:glutamate-rich WD repeat-containing protein 1-like n=1 Tax=Sycon ciliatum TaxID=27933 RepID=UPI0031F65950
MSSSPSEDEAMSSSGSESEDEAMDAGDVYLPGKPIEENEELVYDSTAYHLYHAAQTEAPCLSFDFVKDALGDARSEYPMTAFVVAGTQAEASKQNHLMLMKLHGMERTKQASEDDDDEDDDEDSDDESTAEMCMARVKHTGPVNRVRCACVENRQVVATFAETGHVHLWDTTSMLQRVDNPIASGGSKKKKANVHDLPGTPLFTFRHQREGFALDWSPVVGGRLASGDCHHHIHIWEPDEAGKWNVNQHALASHKSSVEDLQWSPDQAHVLASCSSDQSVRVWDVRAKPSKACMITVENAHSADVNVLSWNRKAPFFVTGGDDGVLRTWDLRQLSDGQPIAEFKHHTAAITSVEWLPSESSVFASSGADDQLVQWDLSLETDKEAGKPMAGGDEVPPALLFIHQGQKDIKELHWHPQIPGLMVSTALSGFNVFKTISV